jgi:hypothetical protein
MQDLRFAGLHEPAVFGADRVPSGSRTHISCPKSVSLEFGRVYRPADILDLRDRRMRPQSIISL